MKIDLKQPYCIVYALLRHEYLGYLIDPYAVQTDAEGRLSLRYQKLSSMNVGEFTDQTDQTDRALIRLSEEMHPDSIARRFATKKMTTQDFFLKTYDKDKGNRQLQETIYETMEKHRATYLSKLANKRFFIMATDGNPAHKEITYIHEPVEVKAHYRRHQEGTSFFLQLFHQGERLQMTPAQSGIVICTTPAWLLIGQRLYHFKQPLDGKKLYPFLKKDELKIPRQAEEQYFKNVLPQFLGNFQVTAEGLDIRTYEHPLQTTLYFAEMPEPVQAELFQGSGQAAITDFKMQFDLHFRYGSFKFRPGQEQSCTVLVECKTGNYIIHKIIRQPEQERAQLKWLVQNGLEIGTGKAALCGKEALEWLQVQQSEAAARGIRLIQANQDSKKYFIGESHFDLQIKEAGDWFDIQAKIRFGDYEIPFIQNRK